MKYVPSPPPAKKLLLFWHLSLKSDDQRIKNTGNVKYFAFDQFQFSDKCGRLVRHDTCSLQILLLSLVIDKRKAHYSYSINHKGHYNDLVQAHCYWP